MTRHVVVVDDQRLNLRVLNNTAAKIRDVIVHPFLSSSDALAWCRDKDVDCFVLDYRMPAPDGLEMIRQIRAVDTLVPIVIVTAESDREVIYRAFDLGANDFIHKPVDGREFAARLSTLLELRAAQKGLAMRIGLLEAALQDSEERSRQHADRLEALWKVVNNPGLSDEERWLAMLREAGAAIRPGQAYRGMLGRVAGDNLVLEAIAEPSGDKPKLGYARMRVGSTLPLAKTIVAKTISDGGGTQSRDDIRADGVHVRLRNVKGWRAVITTTFFAGGVTHVLSFVSSEPNSKSFGAQDHAFIEVLASFFANDLQQRWQSERIQYQQSHDVLTGLLNRSKFRSLARLASLQSAAYAVVLVDISGFRKINESYSYKSGS